MRLFPHLNLPLCFALLVAAVLKMTPWISKGSLRNKQINKSNRGVWQSGDSNKEYEVERGSEGVCFEVLPAISVHPPPSRGSAEMVYAWRIIGGFDNHSHTPKTNAITKLIVFKVEAGSGRRSQQS